MEPTVSLPRSERRKVICRAHYIVRWDESDVQTLSFHHMLQIKSYQCIFGQKKKSYQCIITSTGKRRKKIRSQSYSSLRWLPIPHLIILLPPLFYSPVPNSYSLKFIIFSFFATAFSIIVSCITYVIYWYSNPQKCFRFAIEVASFWRC